MNRTARHRTDRGSIDWTIVVPVFLVFVIPLMLQYGLTYRARTAAKIAAREGAAAASYRGAAVDEGERVAADFIRQHGRESLFDPTIEATVRADSVRVDVRGRAVRLVPFVSTEVHASSEAVLERFRAESER